MNESASQKVNWKEKLRHELFSYWMTVLYLSFFFGAFAGYRRLILAHYHISYTNYGVALIEALILAKLILIGDMLRLGHRLGNRPLIISILFRSLMFTAWVVVCNVAEDCIRGLLRGVGIAGGFRDFINRGPHELLASCLVVLFTFIPFFALRELNRVLGKGIIWNLFFGRSTPAGFNLPSGHSTTTPPPQPPND